MTPQSIPKGQRQTASQVSDSARIYIEKYGSDAPRQARQRADELIAAGNHEGGELWLRISRRIEEKLSEAQNEH